MLPPESTNNANRFLLEVFPFKCFTTVCGETTVVLHLSLVAPFYIYAGVDSKNKLERDNMIHPSL